MKPYYFLAILLAGAIPCSQPSPREQVGPLPDGGFLLNSGWRLQPTGKQIPLDTFPMSEALSPDVRYLLVLNAGYKPPIVTVLDAANGSGVSHVRVSDGWLGLTFSFKNGVLENSRTLTVVPTGQRTVQDFIGDVLVS